jgi:hypothetical protein
MRASKEALLPLASSGCADNLSDTAHPLTFKRIFSFYLPLVGAAPLMTLTTPLVNVCLAHGVFLNQVLFATASLVSLLLALLSVPAFGDVYFSRILGVPAHIAAASRRTILLLAVTPLMLAPRSAFRGIALLEGKTTIVTKASFVRFIIIGSFGLAVTSQLIEGGLVVGTCAFLAGMATETIVYAVYTRKAVLRLRHVTSPSVTLNMIFQFMIPLSFSSVAWALQSPIIIAFLTRLDDPSINLAGFYLLMPLVLAAASLLTAWQSTALVLAQKRRDLRGLAAAVALAAGLLSLTIWLLVRTQIASEVIRLLYSVSPKLLAHIEPAFILVCVVPPVLGFRFFAQGVLLRMKLPSFTYAATILKLTAIFGCGLVVLAIQPAVSGVVVGVGLLIIGDIVDMLVYVVSLKRQLIRTPLLDR